MFKKHLLPLRKTVQEHPQSRPREAVQVGVIRYNYSGRSPGRRKTQEIDGRIEKLGGKN